MFNKQHNVPLAMEFVSCPCMQKYVAAVVASVDGIDWLLDGL